MWESIWNGEIFSSSFPAPAARLRFLCNLFRGYFSEKIDYPRTQPIYTDIFGISLWKGRCANQSPYSEAQVNRPADTYQAASQFFRGSLLNITSEPGMILLRNFSICKPDIYESDAKTQKRKKIKDSAVNGI